MQWHFTLDTIDAVAADFLNWLPPQKIITFTGDMGVGKTTFIKSLSSQLGVQTPTSSPTFAIVNEYKADCKQAIYHADLYRLQSIDEAIDIGIEELLESGAYVFIEWPQLVAPLLHNYNYVKVALTLKPQTNRLLTAEKIFKGFETQ